jgi:hypothetical protein
MTCLPRFTRDPSDSSYRAFCRCGWNANAGDLTEIQLLADAHRPPFPTHSPSIVPGFVSGLEDYP